MTGCCSTPRPTSAAVLGHFLGLPVCPLRLSSDFSRGALNLGFGVAQDVTRRALHLTGCLLDCAADLVLVHDRLLPTCFLAVLQRSSSSDRPPPDDSVVDDQHDDGADHGHEHAVEIEAGDPRATKSGEEPTTDDCADDPKYDVQHQTLAGFVDHFAGNETCDEAQDEPSIIDIRVLSPSVFLNSA